MEKLIKVKPVSSIETLIEAAFPDFFHSNNAADIANNAAIEGL